MNSFIKSYIFELVRKRIGTGEAVLVVGLHGSNPTSHRIIQCFQLILVRVHVGFFHLTIQKTSVCQGLNALTICPKPVQDLDHPGFHQPDLQAKLVEVIVRIKPVGFKALCSTTVLKKPFVQCHRRIISVKACVNEVVGGAQNIISLLRFQHPIVFQMSIPITDYATSNKQKAKSQTKSTGNRDTSQAPTPDQSRK